MLKDSGSNEQDITNMVIFYPWILLNIAGVVGSILNYFLEAQGFKFWTSIIATAAAGIMYKEGDYPVELVKFLAEVSFD